MSELGYVGGDGPVSAHAQPEEQMTDVLAHEVALNALAALGDEVDFSQPHVLELAHLVAAKNGITTAEAEEFLRNMHDVGRGY